MVEFEQFFRAQHPRLVAIALALVGDVESARDTAQEALLRAYRDWERVRDSTNRLRGSGGSS